MNAKEPKLVELSNEEMESVRGGLIAVAHLDIDPCGTPWSPPRPPRFSLSVATLARRFSAASSSTGWLSGMPID
jgi:hypothetical protein